MSSWCDDTTNVRLLGLRPLWRGESIGLDHLQQCLEVVAPSQRGQIVILLQVRGDRGIAEQADLRRRLERTVISSTLVR